MREFIEAILVVLCVAFMGFIVYYFISHRGTNTPGTVPVPSPKNNFMEININTNAAATVNYYVIFDATKVPCIIGPNKCHWNNSALRYSLTNTGQADVPLSSYLKVTDNVLQVKNKQTLRLAIPYDPDTKSTYWTNGSDRSGTGFILSKGPTVPTAGAVTRFEFNYNAISGANEVNYDISCVDAATSNMTVSYMSPAGATSGATFCTLGPCPAQFLANDGRCLSPKWLPNAEPSPVLEYGCPVTGDDDPFKCTCRHFWASDPKAIAWLNYVNNNGVQNARCQAYGWAFDEKKLIVPSNPSCGENNLTDNPLQPDRVTQLTPGGKLVINVSQIL